MPVHIRTKRRNGQMGKLVIHEILHRVVCCRMSHSSRQQSVPGFLRRRPNKLEVQSGDVSGKGKRSTTHACTA